ncbi:class I SAM-dependent methyltransferase [Paenibacillus tengchongensis]|uniref:class I SAM-dependent methyltransferase n=1 Tax=Paenibacillus tengchongensis TaxID=2608684 RepID=UPI00124F1880|nr:class I SAM-dependent methyltransferase [Paenibacillus tengchongensis]
MNSRKDVLDLNAYDEVCQWERTEAVKLLGHCGLEAGMTVMDIGCGFVHYTIPAAIAAGPNGSVIAIEKLKKIIKHAGRRLDEAGLTNVELMNTNHLGLPDAVQNQIDFLMMYDVIHHSPRSELLETVVRCLKQDGILSFLAFKDLSGYKTSLFEVFLKEVIEDIEASGFTLKSEIPLGGVHFDHFHSSYHWKRYGEVRLASLERGTVYNFVNTK